MIKIAKFVRKPFYVNAVQVTKENINEIAKWCGGTVLSNFPPNMTESVDYIKVNVKSPLTVRQTMAYIGDWVLASGNSYKVYTSKAFQGTFVPVDSAEDENQDLDQLPAFVD